MKKEEIVSKIDFAIIITVITGVSYALTYLYKAGEFAYYNIPLYFIDIGAKDVFFTMLLLSPAIIGIFMEFPKGLIKSHDNNDNDEGKSVKEQSNKDIMEREIEDVNSKDSRVLEDKEREFLKNEIEKSLLEVINISRKRERIKAVSLLILILGLIISFIFYLMNKQSFILGILGLLQIFSIILIPILNKIKKYGILFSVIFLFLLLFPLGYGFNYSYTDKHFITFEENKNSHVVLAIYKDQFLFVPLDKKKKEYKNEFNLIEIKNVKNFQMENIGQLYKQK